MSQDQTRHTLSFMDLIRLSTRIFAVKPLRTFLTILGTSIGISTVVFLISLGYGLQYILLGKLITTQDSLITLEATYPDEAALNITQSTIDELNKLPNLTEISRTAEPAAEIKISDAPGVIVARVVDFNYFRLSGVAPDVGEAFSDSKPGVILSAQAASLIDVKPTVESLGKQVSVKLYYQQEDGTTKEVDMARALPIVGFITDQTQSPLAIIPINALPLAPPVFKTLFVKAKDINAVQSVKDQLTEKGYLISARLDLVNQAQKILNILTIVLGVFGVAALTVSAVGMFNTMIVSFMERTYEVGVMKSLGAMDSDVRNLFLMESLIMGVSGGVMGIAMGMGGGAIFNFILNIVAKRLGGKPFTLFITPIWFILLVIGSSAMIGLISGFWPARRASGLSPKEAFLRK